jgi:hypothetical protein
MNHKVIINIFLDITPRLMQTAATIAAGAATAEAEALLCLLISQTRVYGIQQ